MMKKSISPRGTVPALNYMKNKKKAEISHILNLLQNKKLGIIDFK